MSILKSLIHRVDRKNRRAEAKEAHRLKREVRLSRRVSRTAERVARREKRRAERDQRRCEKFDKRADRALARAALSFAELDAKLPACEQNQDYWSRASDRLARRVKLTDESVWYTVLLTASLSLGLVFALTVAEHQGTYPAAILGWIMSLAPVLRGLFCFLWPFAVSLPCIYLIPYLIIRHVNLTAEAELAVAGIAHPVWNKQHTIRFMRNGDILRSICVYLQRTNKPPTDEEYAAAYMRLKYVAGAKGVSEDDKRRVAEIVQASSDCKAV